MRSAHARGAALALLLSVFGSAAFAPGAQASGLSWSEGRGHDLHLALSHSFGSKSGGWGHSFVPLPGWGFGDRREHTGPPPGIRFPNDGPCVPGGGGIATPEPTAAILLAAGLSGLAVAGRRRRDA